MAVMRLNRNAYEARARQADKWLRRFRWAMIRALKPALEKPNKFSEATLAARIRNELELEMQAAALGGYHFARGFDLGKPAGKAALRLGWEEAEEQIEEREEILARRLSTDVHRRVETVAAHNARTTLTGIEDKLRRAVDENWTVAELRKEVIHLGRVSAERVARSETIWSYNEGARNAYRDEGIARMQWLVTRDDLTCEDCLALNDLQVGIDDEFVAAGEAGPLGMAAPWGIDHPPLHPSCRCALMPVIQS